MITDTKGNLVDMFTEIVEQASMYSPSVLTRIIPQVYAEADIDDLNAIHYFPHVIHTLYRKKVTNDEVIAITQRQPQVFAITMSKDRYSEPLVQKLNQRNILTFVHTVNKSTDVQKYLNAGVTGVYTDFYSE